MTKSAASSLVFAAAVLILSGCVTTSIRGYSDRDYQNHRITRISVRAPNASFTFGEILEQSIVKKLAKKGVEAASFINMFPPTRDWTNDEVASELEQQGYDSIMYVNLIASDTSSQTIGYVNNGRAYAYGNMASYSGTSTAMTALSRYTSTRVKIYDVRNAKVIWVGDSNTEAGGFLYMSDETQAASIATEIVTALQEAGHL